MQTTFVYQVICALVSVSPLISRQHLSKGIKRNGDVPSLDVFTRKRENWKEKIMAPRRGFSCKMLKVVQNRLRRRKKEGRGGKKERRREEEERRALPAKEDLVGRIFV